HFFDFAAAKIERRRRRLPLLDHALSDRRARGRGESRELLERLLDLRTPLLGSLQRRQHRPLALGADVVAPTVASVDALSHPIRPSCLSLASIIAATPAAPPSAASTSIHCSAGSRPNHAPGRRAWRGVSRCSTQPASSLARSPAATGATSR